MSASDRDVYGHEGSVSQLNVRGREDQAVVFLFAAVSSRTESKGSGVVVATDCQVPTCAACAQTARVGGHLVTKPRSFIAYTKGPLHAHFQWTR